MQQAETAIQSVEGVIVTKLVFGKPSKRVNPKGYQRSSLKAAHILSVLAGRDWVAESVIIAAVSDVIQPEAAIRSLQSRHGKTLPFNAEVISKGRADLVRRRLWQRLRSQTNRKCPKLWEVRERDGRREYRALQNTESAS